MITGTRRYMVMNLVGACFLDLLKLKTENHY